MATDRTFVVDPFCARQFDEASKKTPFINMSIEDFEAKVNEMAGAEPKLHDGYAPFCKHLFVENFVGATVNVLPITPENEGLVRQRQRQQAAPRCWPAASTDCRRTMLNNILGLRCYSCGPATTPGLRRSSPSSPDGSRPISSALPRRPSSWT